jgi:hypothetical protein
LNNSGAVCELGYAFERKSKEFGAVLFELGDVFEWALRELGGVVESGEAFDRILI